MSSSFTQRQPTADDVRGAIAAQHVKITTLVQEVSLAGPDTRAARLRELLAYLAGHEAVEEELIHPLLAAVVGEQVALPRMREEDGMAQQIDNLEHFDVESPSFTNQFGLIEDALNHHSRSEEVDELPHLESALSDGDASLIIGALEAQDAAAATRRGSFAEMLESARSEVRTLRAQHG